MVMAETTFYHATFYHYLPRIVKDGIRKPNSRSMGRPPRRNWGNVFGGKLGKDVVYAFTSETDALRWAFKMEYDYERPACVVKFQWEGEVIPDENFLFTRLGRSVYIESDIPPSNIDCILPLTPCRKQAIVFR